jgi:hypothetical protein
VNDDLLAARQLLVAIGQEHRQTADTIAEARLKVRSDRERPPAAPAGDALISALEPWLAKLDAEAAAGRWQPVRVGLDRWNAAAREYRNADWNACRESQLLLDERRDLRGLLGALKAKAMANGRAEDAALAELEFAANTLLAQRPTPLEALRSAVAEYQQHLL